MDESRFSIAPGSCTIVQGLPRRHSLMCVALRRSMLTMPPSLGKPRADEGSPASRARCFRTCTGSLTARGSCASCDIDAQDMAFLLSLASAPRSKVLSRRNARPVRNPVNASAMPSRAPPHDSGARGSDCPSLTLSLTTPRRFIRAHKERYMDSRRDFIQSAAFAGALLASGATNMAHAPNSGTSGSDPHHGNS